MAAPAPRSADAAATTGITAVQQSKKAREQQEILRDENETSSSFVKTARGKTFYLREKVWVDAEYKDDAKLPETRVQFASREYYELLKAKPQLAAFFALGEQVTVVIDGHVYRVEAASP
jgi:hypothetical protein